MKKTKLLAVILAAALSLMLAGCSGDAKKPIKLSAPAGLQISGTTLTWGAVPNASGYSVDIDGVLYTASANSYSLSALSDYRTYTIKVMAIGDNTAYSSSAWSDSIPYTIDEPGSETPQLETPAGLEIYESDHWTMILKWNAVPDAQSYVVEIDGASYGANQTSYSLSSLTTAKTYSIRVRAIGDGVNFRNSEWSAPVSYTVEPTEPPSGNIEDMSCRQIIDYIFANVQQTPYMTQRTPEPDWEDWGWYSGTQEVRNLEAWFLGGVTGVPFTEATAFESPMNGDFSLVVIRLEAGANAAQWRDSIYSGLNPMKWICMGGNAKRVVRIGNVILAVIANTPDIDNIVATFNTLA